MPTLAGNSSLEGLGLCLESAKSDQRFSRKANSLSSGRYRASFDTEGRGTRERFFLQTHICVEIHLCCLHGFVPQPEVYRGAVNSMLQKVHGGAVPN
jgi:hypothetical protein